MNIDNKYIDQMESDRQHQDFRLEKILLNFTAEISARMEELGINQTELAKKMGISRAFVSKVMNCNHNITLKTMDSISNALGMDIKVQVHEKRGVEEELAAKNGFVLLKFEQQRYKTSSSRVVINKSITQLGLPWLAYQEPSIYKDNRQESANNYDYSETKIA